MWALAAGLFQHSKNSSKNKDMWGWSCVQNQRAEVFREKVQYTLVCRLQNWSLICIIIEVVIEAISIILYSVVFYRYYSKRKLTKSMDLRDRARSDLYLAQLRSQSAPNTPGFGPKSPSWGGPTTPGFGPKSPALSQYAMSPRHPPAAYRNLSDIDENASPFTPGAQVVEPQSQFAGPQPSFKLQAPPTKAPSATPKHGMSPLTPTSAPPSFPPNNLPSSNHASVTNDEPSYDAVPIPGAYSDAALKSPPPNQTSFGQAS